jgi:hypothetical protein
VSDEEWFTALHNMFNEISDHLIISSDSEISPEMKLKVNNLATENRVKVIFLEGGNFDECDLHSTFSFTAAVLGKQGMKSLIPNAFYADAELEQINQGFRSAGTFFLLG